MDKLNVLFVASECAPFVKTGGLADVIGALPKALAAEGANTKIILPNYPAMAEVSNKGKIVLQIDDLFGGAAKLIEVKSDALNLLVLDAPHLYNRPGNIYLDENGQDWGDNHLRFGALCKVAAEIASNGLKGWRPTIVHAHDWQAGLTPLLIKMANLTNPPKCLFTIHNIAFQGLFDWSIKDFFSIPDEYFNSEGAEYWGHLGFLKAGLSFSDQITTVSPNYAKELLSPEFGLGLEGLLQAKSHQLSGIINGIDLVTWNPENDEHLAQKYSFKSISKKTKNREVVQDLFGLDKIATAPLFCVISRLTSQKGLDLLLETIPELVDLGAQLALLGTGEKHLEDGFVNASKKYNGHIGVKIGYDESLSHILQGGCDAILVPSRFEPCGLTQLYGLRYGTIPVVASRGGLADTVIDANKNNIKSKLATGIKFEPVTVEALRDAISRACELYAKPTVWKTIVKNAMNYPVGWNQSAPAYLSLYKSMITHKSKK
ncbi:MAG: glycogen synthase GlgA [Nitratireductor sp.]